MAQAQRLPSVQVGRTPRTLQEAADTFLADCKARNLSPCTVTLNGIILRGLRDFLGDADLQSVTATDLRRFLIDKASNTSPATAARYYDALKRFWRFLATEGFVSADPMTTIEKPRAPVPIIQPLSSEQVDAMLEACDPKSFSGLRDRLILLVLVDCGLRASELCGLTLADVDLENQQLLIRHGKGDRSRRVPFGAAVLSLLRQYIARRAEVDTASLFVTVYGEPLDRFRLRAIVMRAAERAKVTHPHMGPHLLRHTCGVQLLRAGADSFTVQKVLGHSTLLMTRRYCELADSDIQAKHRLYSPGDRLKNAAPTGKRRRLK